MITRILDTNVILDTPLRDIVNSFKDGKIVIHSSVLQELDTFKSSKDETLHKNSRLASAYLDELRKCGNLSCGVILESNKVFVVDLGVYSIPGNTQIASYTDNQIIGLSKYLSEQNQDVILYTNDINVRIAADILNIQSEAYDDSVGIGGLYSGWSDEYLPNHTLNELSREGYIDFPSDIFTENQYLILHNSSNPNSTLLAKYIKGRIVKLNDQYSAFGIQPLNVEQKFLMDLLLDPNIPIVSCIGLAGSGKTLLTMACGLEHTKVIGSQDVYDKVLAMRSPIPVGKDIGYLPGDEKDKIGPWMGSVYDSLEVLTKGHAGDKNGKAWCPESRIQSLLDFGRLELKAMTFVRGRSIPNQYIVIDEAQNLTKHEIKTLVTRIGLGTKIVILGDIEQIDNTKLSRSSNGLVHLINSLRGESLYGHITLTKSERSPAAEVAAKLL